MKIFFIDDDKSINTYHQIILEDIFKQENIEPRFFLGASDALQELKRIGVKDYPDCIFLDVNMPIMNGWEFISAYKKLKLPRTKIIILTTSRNPNHEKKAKGIDIISGYRLKPLEQKYFKSLVKNK